MRALKAVGWGILGYVAAELFSVALQFAFVGITWLFGYWDQAADSRNTMGFRQRATVSVIALLPEIAVGIAIRRRRRAFVVRWFVPVSIAALQLIYFFGRALLDEGFRNQF